MAPGKRALTQRQLENLAKGNPKVAKRLKAGDYADRIGVPAPDAKPRKRRSQPAALPGTKRPAAAAASPRPAATPPRKPAGKKPATQRRPRAGGDDPPKRRSFLSGLLGGG